MRTIHTLPLAAAMLLAACGGSETDADGDGEISGEEVAAASAEAVKPEPGQYRTSYELLEFDAPGLPEALKQQMQAQMGGAAEVARGITYCLTPEDVASQGSQQMVENMAEGNCTFAKYDVSGGDFSADMQCSGPDGTTNHVVMDGQMTSTGSTVTMTTEQEIAGQQVVLKTRIRSERTGDCTS